MQILIVLFSLTGLGSLYGMIRYGGWHFTIHSANLVFGYIFLFSAVMVLWSFLALKKFPRRVLVGCLRSSPIKNPWVPGKREDAESTDKNSDQIDPGAGRVIASLHLKLGRGKSELHRAGCHVTRGLGNKKDSATENKPPRIPQGVRGKGEKAR